MSNKDYRHVPSQLLDGAAESLAYGNTKYGEGEKREAKSVNDRYNSLMGHLQAWKAGHTEDCESGLCHLKHAAMQMAFLMEGNEAVEVEVLVNPNEGKTMYWAANGLCGLEFWSVKPTDYHEQEGYTDGNGGIRGHIDSEVEEIGRKLAAKYPGISPQGRELIEVYL